MDIGIQSAARQSVANPLPIGWLGRADMPPALPAWAAIDRLSTAQIVNLQAQLGYDASGWDYTMVGANNELGRYQFSASLLESYGLLAPGSTVAYGTDCVNYQTCWRPVTIRKNTNSYANYIYDADSISSFLSHTSGQEHLAYQVIYDLYNNLVLNNGIQSSDSAEVIAGMIAVAWQLGAGIGPTSSNLSGTGAYAWRHFNLGNGTNSYNSGRYAASVLSQ
jgi:hypothetical protein